MSATVSPSSGRRYGLQRVCRTWALPRSTFYARRERPAGRPRRGPVPPVDDASLLAAIQADLAASPFRGEGHRKVWARLGEPAVDRREETARLIVLLQMDSR